ncbi:ADP-ribosylglycohydrolase family protein [Bacillus sp. FJAT-29953]|nr:ADP-ribosylglycohydrolase family protein [Bacillus sp. FJAT-29953]
MLDKIKGAIFGVAIGDALGATTEFMTREEISQKHGKVTAIIGGGYWGVKAGEVTDDTEMTIAVIKGIIANSGNPIEEIGKQFLHWKKSGPVDIGITIRAVLDRYQGDWFRAAEEVHYLLDGKSAGNGSLMRCLPIAMAYSDKRKIEELSVMQSKITHYDDLAAEACVIYNLIAKRVLEGEDLKTAIHTEIKNTRYDISYQEEPSCPPDGFVVNSMKWVLYWLLTSETFEEVVIGAANMGHDSDTIAAIAGGLKGLEVGFDSLPRRYTGILACNKCLTTYSNVLWQIRDRDTAELNGNLDDIFADLENKADQLNEQVEQGASHEDNMNLLKVIGNHINLFRISFTEDDPEFDAKFLTWWRTENRFLRSRRLIDLGAPKIIILHELNWLLTMINHLGQRYRGENPQFTEDQLEELEMAREMESSFEEEERPVCRFE